MNLPNYDHHLILLMSRKGWMNSTLEDKETRAGEDLADLWSHFTISSLEKPETSTILSTISNILLYVHNLHNPSLVLNSCWAFPYVYLNLGVVDLAETVKIC